ncbi:hypothetical protein HCN44_001838 [Aphidius gifuensis]|uniref:Calponin-homology (CH) domain-containing protein n=1 Tax=Aphidius gifuensis TaxID=684658 RepID=A0A834Y0A5_APHGI|nr:ras GTPase-activating-like protein IQGAP2 [Aphidius gifuensis]KAF7996206.1 hypothetical protein HCN44_001838 [Aphidius gifuensis]
MVAISNIQRSNSGRNINCINKTKSYFNISKENNKMKKKPSKWHRRSVSLSDLDKCEIISSLFTKFHELNMEKRQSSEEMDQQRQRTMAYEYLCHLEQVKKWLETCFNETLPPSTELEENLRNGVYLARLANLINPNLVPVKKIYDFNQDKYIKYGLQYRHIDNINYFIKFVESKNLPKNHQPETTDIYDKKNMPRLIYCIYLLSSDMFNSGETTKIENLCGKIQFSDDDIDAVCQEMKKNGIELLLTEFSGLDLTNIKLSDDDDGGDGDDNTSSNFQEIININNDNNDDNIETKPVDIINETFDISFINALDKIRHNYSVNNIYQNDQESILA